MLRDTIQNRGGHLGISYSPSEAIDSCYHQRVIGSKEREHSIELHPTSRCRAGASNLRPKFIKANGWLK